MRCAIITLGCKVNQYESDALRGLFVQAGFESVAPQSEAEVYVINSCTVTAVGDAKTRKLLRRIRGKHPGACIALTGCFPQAFPTEAAALPEADVLTGTKNRAALPGLVRDWLSNRQRQVEVSPLDFQGGETFEDLSSSFSTQRTRAFLKIQDGCERLCAYCIIPSARGPVRSRPLSEVRQEARRLGEKGFRELVLVGINLSCYGTDLDLSLVEAVSAAAEAGIKRVRLGSLEPELLSWENIQRLSQIPALCPQFHLSLQSGCDDTLSRMRRHYTTQQYRRIVQDLRETFPNCAVTTDVMVGFPGESQEEFARSLDFCRSMGFAKVHVFPFSPRPGTAAADFGGQVSPEDKTSRAKSMTQAMEESRAAFLQSQVGAQVRVLLEKEEMPGVWQGYTENYTPVRLPVSAAAVGDIIPATLTGAGSGFCTGQQWF